MAKSRLRAFSRVLRAFLPIIRDGFLQETRIFARGMMSLELKKALLRAADKYETTDFIAADPVQFPHRFSERADIEVAGLLTAIISFGSRRQILAKAETLMEMMGEHPAQYVREGRFEADFRDGDGSSFYRMISHSDFRKVLCRLRDVYRVCGSLEEYLSRYDGTAMERMCAFLGVSPLGPQKKINMYLRWMVRRDSAVDFGLWRSYSPSELIIPLDTHVAHVAYALGIVERESYSLPQARRITAALEEVFPSDPVRGDFALFGLGVDGVV